MLSPLLSTIDYESQDARDDSDYQVAWSNIMDKGPYEYSSTHQKAEVLLLRWANDSDDLATGEEVNRLRAVFEKQFKYHTHTKLLNTKTGPNLQVQINAIIATFVAEHSGPHTLLIVYYAGHGRQGNHYGTLELHNG